MSTLNNYMFQSFNFRGKKLRAFYDIVASITAEEFGHVELVANTINLMLVGTTAPETLIPPRFVQVRMLVLLPISLNRLRPRSLLIPWADPGTAPMS